MKRDMPRLASAIAISVALVAASLTFAGPASAAGTTTLYVAPNGNDSASGTSSGAAFKTLARAQQAVRDANATNNVDVVLADGTYTVTQPIKFGTADGGHNGNSVTWKAADGARPVISGGKAVTGWTDSDGDGIWEAPLDSAIDFRQLYVNGTQALRSRMWVDYGKFSFSRSGFTVDSGYVSSGQVGNAWTKLKALSASQQKRVELRSRASFTDRFSPFSSISNNVVTMRQPSWDNNTWGWDTINKPLHSPAFSLRNALAFVDEDNEWFYDTDAKKLFYKPAQGANPNNISIVAPQVESLVQISGDSASSQVTNLAFSGLSFQYSSETSANGDEGYASQQNGAVVRGYLYALTDPTTKDLPTTDQRTFDPSKNQAPLVRIIFKDSSGTYRYVDDNSVVASGDQSRLLRLRDYPTMPLNSSQLATWNANNPNNQKQPCQQGAYPTDCRVFEANRNMFQQTPAAVQVSAAKGVSFTLNEFTHLGSKGLGIGMNDEGHGSRVGLGAQDVSVVGNTFYDIAGSAIVAGGTSNEAARPSSDVRANRNVTISNNRIKKMGQDYFESSAVLATYIDGAEISNNELSDGPYDVVDTGWGWGVPDAGGNSTYQGRGTYIFNTRYAANNSTQARNIHVARNVMWDFKKEGNDGGVLYHLGAAPGSSWDSNYLRGGDGTKLYFDEGTRYMTAKNNAMDNTYYQAFANGFVENQGTPSDNVGNSTRDNTIDGTWWLGGGINAGPWCADSAKCDASGQYYNNRITNRSQLGINEFPLAAQKVIAESGIQAQYRKAGDFVPQSRGLDLAISRNSAGEQIITATVANLGSSPLSDIALQVTGSGGVSLTQLTSAPASLAPGVTATATYRVTGSDPVTSGTVSANAAMTRQDVDGTTRETVYKSLSVALGGSVASGLLTAAPSIYAENQIVQTGGTLALQNRGRDIGEGGDEYTTVYKSDVLASGGSITTKFEGGNTGWYRAGISVRNDLSKMADRSVSTKSLGYAHLAIEPNWVALRYDSDGDGVIDTQAAAAQTTTRPLWVKLSRSNNTVTASYSTDGTTFTNLGQAPLFGADASLDAGVVQSSAGRAGNSGELGTSTARYSSITFPDGSGIGTGGGSTGGTGGSTVVRPVDQTITQVDSGKCLDIQDQLTQNGTRAHLWDCLGQTNQKFTYTSANELKVYGNKCLDASGANTAPGTRIQVWDCHGGDNQKWFLNPNGTITGKASGLCVASTGGQTANGSTIELATCTGASIQRWAMPIGAVPANAIFGNAAENKCMDISGRGTQNGTQAQLWDCLDQENQKFTYTSAGELRVYGNKCLDASGDGRTAGTRVQIWDCHGGDNQKWTLNGSGTITGKASGLCIGTVNGASGTGSALQLANCSDAAVQRWAIRS